MVSGGDSILIVEDDLITARLLSKILADNGYQSEMAYNEEMACQSLQQNFQLVLIDIGLEKQTGGLHLARHIRTGLRLPFIFVSANEDPDILQRALEIKPASYLSKPINPFDVIAAVRLALESLGPADQRVTLRCGRDLIQFLKRDLLYACTDGNYLRLITVNQSFFVRCTMSKLTDTLNDNCFYRIHRTLLVNVERIERLNAKGVLLNGRWLKVARTRKQGLRNAMESVSKRGDFY